jgi:hypothetical protein
MHSSIDAGGLDCYFETRPGREWTTEFSPSVTQVCQPALRGRTRAAVFSVCTHMALFLNTVIVTLIVRGCYWTTTSSASRRTSRFSTAPACSRFATIRSLQLARWLIAHQPSGYQRRPTRICSVCETARHKCVNAVHTDPDRYCARLIDLTNNRMSTIGGTFDTFDGIVLYVC